METLLTLPEVADALRMHRLSVLALFKSGEIRASKIGARGVWRVRKSDLDAYLDRTAVCA